MKSIYTNPGIICPVVRYAPISAIKPIIANLTLSFSAMIFSFSTVFVSFICLLSCLAKTLTTFTAGKLRLGYPESIIPEEIPF